MNILSNDYLTIYIEGMKKINQRFDHCGCITQVHDNKRDINYLSKEENPVIKDNQGIGICDEFCASKPIGFEEAAIGEWFVKPGCGIMKKTGLKYKFTEKYPFNPIEVNTSKNENTIVFRAEQKEVNGYSYRYEKEYCLIGRELTITYKILNLGNKPILWQSYAHNFFLPGAYNVKNLHVKVNANSIKGWECTEGDPILMWDDVKQLEVKNNPILPALYIADFDSNIENTKNNMSIEIENNKMKCRIIESIDWNPIKLKIWIHEKCICPELFIEGNQCTNEEVQWKRKYSFY